MVFISGPGARAVPSAGRRAAVARERPWVDKRPQTATWTANGRPADADRRRLSAPPGPSRRRRRSTARARQPLRPAAAATRAALPR